MASYSGFISFELILIGWGVDTHTCKHTHTHTHTHTHVHPYANMHTVVRMKVISKTSQINIIHTIPQAFTFIIHNALDIS